MLETWLVSFSSEFLSGAYYACECHFSYDYATSVNFVRLMLMLMPQCKPGFTVKARLAARLSPRKTSELILFSRSVARLESVRFN